MTPEGKVKKRLTEGLDQLGAYWFFPATHGYGRSGVPDIVACIDGEFWAFECKAEGSKPTALQEKEIEKIRATKGFAMVVTGEGQAETALQLIETVTGRVRVRHDGASTGKSRSRKTSTRLRAD